MPTAAPVSERESLQESSPLVSLADGVWLCAAPVRFLALRLTTTMVVLRLPGGALLVWSPVALTPERRAAVESLGRVAHLYAPDLFHHRWLGDWIAAFPGARVHAPPGLGKKRPDLRIDRVHGTSPEPAFAGVIDELPLAGCRLQETDLYYRPGRTLIVADLVHNIGRPAHAWTATYTRVMGFYDRIALSKMIRWTAFTDRAAARRSVDDLLALPFEKVVVGHGPPLAGGGKDAIAAAYGWLRA
jgi:hypothetical protein